MPRLIPLLATRPLEQILEEPFVAAADSSLAANGTELDQNSARSAPRVRREQCSSTLPDLDLEGYNKFVPYYLHPECDLQRRAQQEQLPGEGLRRLEPMDYGRPIVNLAKICERYGGGGHARVGAISFNVNQHAAAIKASQEIVNELRAAVRIPKS